MKDRSPALACPTCRTRLARRSRQAGLWCRTCRRAFPARDGAVDLTLEPFQAFERFDDVERIADLDRRVKAAQVYYHDRLGLAYETDWSTGGIFTPRCRRRIVNVVRYAAKLGGRGAALDIGCGTGNVLSVEAAEFHHAVGVDLSPAMVDICRTRGLDAHRADATALPFADATFDLVTLFSVLHHMVHPEQVFPEVLRVLKPGGVLYTDWDQNRHLPFHPYMMFFINGHDILKTVRTFIQTRIAPDDLTRAFKVAEYHPYQDFLDGEELRDDLLAAGFRVAKVLYHANRGTPFDADRPGLPANPADLPENLRWRRLLPVFLLLAVK